MPTAASGKLDGGAIDWLLYLVAAMGWPLAFLVAVAVTLLALGRKAAEKAAEKAVEHTFAKAGKDYELSAGRRSAFVQRVLTDRWEAVEDLFARLQRITTNLNRSRTGHAVPSDLFDASPSGQEVVPPDGRLRGFGDQAAAARGTVPRSLEHTRPARPGAGELSQ